MLDMQPLIVTSEPEIKPDRCNSCHSSVRHEGKAVRCTTGATLTCSLAGRYATNNGELRERLRTDPLHLQSDLRLP
jgi:hypothetical protein